MGKMTTSNMSGVIKKKCLLDSITKLMAHRNFTWIFKYLPDKMTSHHLYGLRMSGRYGY